MKGVTVGTLVHMGVLSAMNATAFKVGCLHTIWNVHPVDKIRRLLSDFKRQCTDNTMYRIADFLISILGETKACQVCDHRPHEVMLRLPIPSFVKRCRENKDLDLDLDESAGVRGKRTCPWLLEVQTWIHYLNIATLDFYLTHRF